MTKPPIGVKPRIIHIENRIAEIGRAIMIYVDSGTQIPKEWIDELEALVITQRILKKVDK